MSLAVRYKCISRLNGCCVFQTEDRTVLCASLAIPFHFCFLFTLVLILSRMNDEYADISR